ncbi:MAG: glycosyltransferase [Acidimicrobiales bacterium]
MRVYLDLQAAQSVLHPERGIARYVTEHAAALMRAGAPVARLGFNPSLPRPLHLPEVLSASPKLAWGTAREVRAARREGAMAYHVMSPFERTEPDDGAVPAVAFDADALVVTVYDLIPLLFAARYLHHPHLRLQYEARLEVVRHAELICAISEHTRADVIQHLGVSPERCVTIGTGASDLGPNLTPVQAADEVRARLPGIVRPYVLCVAGWDWRKNVEALIRSYASLPDVVRSSRQLVITCSLPADGRTAWEGAIQAAGLAPEDVVLTGRVENRLLQALYRCCDLFVFPSLYEGFGLPVLEAARCGAPAITSSTSSLPEILDWEPSTFDPTSDGAIAEALERGLTDETHREGLRVAGARAAGVHTWERVARRTIAAYEGLHPSPRRGRQRSARIAFVGPLPPSRSGVAIYNDRVLPHLPASWDVTCFYEGDRPTPVSDRTAIPVSQLGRLISPWAFDAIVFVVGNSTFHEHTIELARQVPGIVWLHDVNLSGIARYQAGRTGRPGDREAVLRRLLVESYGEVWPWVEAAACAADGDPEAWAMLRLASRVVARAEAVIVNSNHAASLLRMDVGSRPLPPVSIIPHLIPTPAEQGLLEHVERSADPLVVSLGIVDDVKRPSDLLAAVAQVPGVRLRFVGECAPALESRLRDEARALGCGSRLEVTGWLPRGAYARAAAEGWVAVQLRRTTNGESSGAVADAIGLGLPVVTTIPSALELPAHAVTCLPVEAPVGEIAGALRSLLAGDIGSTWQAVGASARDWAAADVAERVADVVRSVAHLDV